MLVHNLGFPRIGLKRELKKTTENFWKSKNSETDLLQAGQAIRNEHWQLQKDQGIDLLPVGDFSFYDQMLDMTATLGAIPDRYGWSGGDVDINTYFMMARGDHQDKTKFAMEMTKWFDTNYHYIVPEFVPGQKFALSSNRLFDQLKEASKISKSLKAVMPGPFTYIYLGKSLDSNFDRWQHLDAIVSVYEEILSKLQGKCTWVQLDEPILVLDLPKTITDKFQAVYERLKKAAGETPVMLATYFGTLANNASIIKKLPVDALHVDLVRAPEQLDSLLKDFPDKMSLSLGVIDGRNIWRADLDKASSKVKTAVDKLGKDRTMLAPSCSLLHVPIDLDAEKKLSEDIRSWMAFAKQKCGELSLLKDQFEGKDVAAAFEKNRSILKKRETNPQVHNHKVRERVDAITEAMARRNSAFAKRREIQQEHLHLPPLPTTSIGSFPQTSEIRKVRRDLKKGVIKFEDYLNDIRSIIQDNVNRQNEIGLDVLVHGEPERNDMVEYFGEQLDGYCFTEHGWVQSYGSRYVKPPIIYGDVHRPKPMTVDWITYAQSLTDKPMKGMLTGPVTMICWSFVRDDQPRSKTCFQMALAIRDEVVDLEKAGIKVIQIDEPALREGLPLRRAQWEEYLEWAVEAFRLATSGVRDETQIHTHMCYSEFNDIVEWIARMDADVISIEASRSRMELLEAFKKFDYPNFIGPGVYDVHSPRVPTTEEMQSLLKKAAEVIENDHLWVNPDCGLKTRTWDEVIPSLKNMVSAAKSLRTTMASSKA